MKKITSILLLCIIVSLVTVPCCADDPCAQYTDVDQAAWYYGGVCYMVRNGLMVGTSETTFSPGSPTTRAMLVTVLYRMSGSPHVSGTSRFSDVRAGSYYYLPVIWAYDVGIVSGTSDTTFSPNDKIKRQDLALILMRYVALRNGDVSKTADLSNYSDSQEISSYAVSAMKWAVGSGIISGVSETAFSPRKSATRAQIAVMVMGLENNCNVGVCHEQFSVNEALQSKVQNFIKAKNGEWAVYVEKLHSGASMYAAGKISYNQPIVCASLIKLWVLGAVYEKIADGTITEADVKTDLYDMITVSDNNCCNKLVKMLGGGNRDEGIAVVNSFAARHGFRETRMTRLMLENTGTQNYTSIRDCAEFLRMLYHGTMISPKASETMLNIMKDTSRVYLAEGLPENVKMAHKTGSLAGLCYGNVGIVFADETYLICVINDGKCKDPDPVFKSLSELIYADLH